MKIDIKPYPKPITITVDYEWIIRDLLARRSSDPTFDEAIELLRQMDKEQNK